MAADVSPVASWRRMRTRTLLLLAVTCGLPSCSPAASNCWRLANQEPPTPLAGVGGTGTGGRRHRHGRVPRSRRRRHVRGHRHPRRCRRPDGLDGFTLVGVDLAVKPWSSGRAPGTCTGFTVAPVECTLVFPNTGFPTDDRQLLLSAPTTGCAGNWCNHHHPLRGLRRTGTVARQAMSSPDHTPIRARTELTHRWTSSSSTSWSLAAAPAATARRCTPRRPASTWHSSRRAPSAAPASTVAASRPRPSSSPQRSTAMCSTPPSSASRAVHRW
jgi:hypothetical protein